MHRRMLRFIAPLLLFCAHLDAADAWKVAGPPPVSWQRDRLADLAARRKAAMEKIGDRGMLLLYAAQPRNYAGDVDWPYRQENDFFYLTAIPQEGAALVLIPGASVREILFLPPSNPLQESWTGHILTPDEARRISGIEEVWDARRLDQFLATLMPQTRTLFEERAAAAAKHPAGPHAMRLPDPPPIPVDAPSVFRASIGLASKGDLNLQMLTADTVEYAREREFADRLKTLDPPLKVVNAVQLFAEVRRVKSAREIDILKHAVDITAEAFQRAYTAAVPGTPEHEIQAQFEFTFLRRNAHWGYPCIVASGANATTLHYETNQDTMKAGDLLLMDDAAEFDGYSVDVTRTIPVNGKFSKEQADIYRLVWGAQQAGFHMSRPGRQMRGGAESVQGAAVEVFKKGLFKLGLITDEKSAQQVAIWFNHGIGHGIGLNVHDPGGPELQPGMVVTVEPGIYIRPGALDQLPKTPENEKFIAAVRPAFEKYKGIGVRIEDDVLITTGEPQILSAGIPSKLEEVESSIARLRKTAKTAPMP